MDAYLSISASGGLEMGFFDETVNSDLCPNCGAKVCGDDAYEFITDQQRCSSCQIPLKFVSVQINSHNEAPYEIYSLEIDSRRM